MAPVTLSSKFQVVIPREVRERLHLRPGQKFQVMAYDGRVQLMAVESAKSLRGFMKGANPDIRRDKTDRTL